MNFYMKLCGLSLARPPVCRLYAHLTPFPKAMAVNCSILDSRSSFSKYITAVNETTNGNFTLAAECKEEICNAFWGSGNPDVDGIGVSNTSYSSHRVC